MTRIRILNAAEQHSVPVSNTAQHAIIPVDGNFHEIHDDLLPVLSDSSVQFEIENADAAGGIAAAAGAAGLGGSAAPAKRKRVRKSRAKAKK
jgi:hypothetical protein